MMKPQVNGLGFVCCPDQFEAPAEVRQTAHRRFTGWSTARVWATLHRMVLDQLGADGALDWSHCAIDSASVRAVKGGP